jgi:hypothetical protein
MISRTRGTPIMEEIAIIKIIGRLVSKIEFITVVALTALALVTVVGGRRGADDDGVTAGMMLEIFCKAFVALVNAAVVFSKALVVFSNLSLTVSEIAPPPVALVVVLLLVNPPPPVVIVVLKGSVALGVGKEEEVVVVASTALSEDNLSMNNRDTRITTAVTVFIYTVFVLFTA